MTEKPRRGIAKPQLSQIGNTILPPLDAGTRRSDQHDKSLSVFINDFPCAVKPLDSRLTIVEWLNVCEAPRISATALAVDVSPPRGISSTSQSLVKDVQIKKPDTVYDGPLDVNVRSTSVWSLHDGQSVPIVPSIGPSITIRREAGRQEMQVLSRFLSYRTEATLEVPAPGEMT